MKAYKKYSNKPCYNKWALDYIKANNIRCRYYGWIGMAGDIDLIKIDGQVRKFDIKTRKEIFA